MARLILVAAVTLGCGPSFTAVYDGDARFEHCYALEERPNASMNQKADCWRDWTQHHTYGQTRDRVEYAASRYRSLNAAPQLPTDEAMMEAAPGMVTTTSLAAPTPTSAFAPPPVTTSSGSVQTWGASPITTPSPTSTNTPPVASISQPAPRPPGADCMDACQSAWQTCAVVKPKCDASYGLCISKCVSPKK
jgi:hypothetical protein